MCIRLRSRQPLSVGMASLARLGGLAQCSPGRILVARHEVFTHERLYGQRVSEIAWLQKQPANDPTFNRQGLIASAGAPILATGVRPSRKSVGRALSGETRSVEPSTTSTRHRA